MRPPVARAMAASTWFHGSAWPPGYHGTMPEGSCHSAMQSTVAATCSGVISPSTPGIAISLMRRSCPLRLGAVQHQALAEDRVQRLLGPPGQLRRLGDVPREEPVVRLHERIVGVGGP